MRYTLTVLFFFLLAMATNVRAAEQMSVNGVARSFELIGAKAREPRPLIVALHGNRGTGAQFGRWANLQALADRHGLVIALPDGLNNAWADGRTAAEIRGKAPPAGTDDVAFLSALAEKLVADKVADRKRLYITGASNGGMMTYRMMCERPDLFAAGAGVIAVLTDGGIAGCKPGKSVPMLIMNGTEDRILHWARSGTYAGTDATVAHFRALNGCTDKAATQAYPDLDASDNSRVTRLAYTCPQGADVVLYRVDGGGHHWPSRANQARFEFILGPRNRDIEAGEEIWAFFKRFSR